MVTGQLLWTEKDGWRCELRVGLAGMNRPEVYDGERLVTSEATVR